MAVQCFYICVDMGYKQFKSTQMRHILTPILVLISLLAFNLCSAQETKKHVEVQTFDLKKSRGDKLILEDSTIVLSSSLYKYSTQLSIEDIHFINVETKKNNSGEGALLGVLIGIIPGAIILVSAANPNSLEEYLFGPAIGGTVLLAGGIIGGIIGARLGKGVSVNIPINGNQQLYEKQKLQLQSYF